MSIHQELQRILRGSKFIFFGKKELPPPKRKPSKVEEIPLDLPAKIEKARAKVEADRIKEKVRRINAEEKFKNIKRKRDIHRERKEYLSNEAERLRKRVLDESFDFKKLFDYLEEKKNKFKIKVFSRSHKTMFGYFETVTINEDGHIVLVIITPEGQVKDLISGPTVRDIFTDFSSLANTIALKFITVNLNDKGEYIDNLDAKMIPKTLNIDGKTIITKQDRANFMDEIARKDEEIRELYSDTATHEEILAKLSSDERSLQLQNKVNEKRAEVAEAVLSGTINKMSEFHAKMADIINQNANYSNQLKVSEDRNEQLEKTNKKIIDILEDKNRKTSDRKALEQVTKIVKWGMDLNKSKKAEKIEVKVPTPKVQIIKEKEPEKKIEEEYPL